MKKIGFFSYLFSTLLLINNAGAGPHLSLPPQGQLNTVDEGQENFKEYKLEVIKKLADRLACVKASTDLEALHKCKRKHKDHNDNAN